MENEEIAKIASETARELEARMRSFILGEEGRAALDAAVERRFRGTGAGLCLFFTDSELLSILGTHEAEAAALVLPCLGPEKAAGLLSKLGPERSAELLAASLDSKADEAEERRLWAGLIHALLSAAEHRPEPRELKRLEAAAALLWKLEPAEAASLLASLEKLSPGAATLLHERYFSFNDIVILDDRATQKLLRETEAEDLAKALKGADEAAKEKFFKNMSQRAVLMLKEDMDYMGPIRVKDVEEAQARILASLRRLEESGEVVVSRSGDLVK